MAYKASMKERFHRNFNSRIRTDSNTQIRTTGIAASLESLYLFNGELRERPAVVNNLIEDKFHLDMTWNGDAYLLGDGGVKLADNGNVVKNACAAVRDINTVWADSKVGKTRLFILNVEWMNQSLAQCYVIDCGGFRFFRSATGTVFNVYAENQSGHRVAWSIDMAAFKDGDPVTIVAMLNYNSATSVCFLNGVNLGVGVVTGDPYSLSSTQGKPHTVAFIGRTSSWSDDYGFDGKIGLYGWSFNFAGNAPPSLADLKQLSIDPYRTLLNTEKSKIDLPNILLPVASDWEIEFEARIGFLPTNDNLVPILTASDSAPNKPRCLNLQAAGNLAYVTVPSWTRQATGTARWEVEIEFEVTDLTGGNLYLLAPGGSTVSSWRVETDGSLVLRNNSSNDITTGPDYIKLNTKYIAKLTREDDTLIRMYVNGSFINSTAVANSSAVINVTQIARYSTSQVRPNMIVYRLKLDNISGDNAGANYYSAEWNASTIPVDDFATVWPSVSGTYNLTIVDPTIAIDPYWTKTPYMTGIFTNSAGQLVWSEGVNNYLTTGFIGSSPIGNNSTRYRGLSASWAGAIATSWVVELEFMIIDDDMLGIATTFGVFSTISIDFFKVTLSADRTTLVAYLYNAAGTLITQTSNVPYDKTKWVILSAESDGTNWSIYVDNLQSASAVNSTTATPTIVRVATSTTTPAWRILIRSIQLTGGTYTATWNSSTGTGKGDWFSTNGQRSLSIYALSDQAAWYDLHQRRFITDPDLVIPQERHKYKISKTGSNITITVDDTRAVGSYWKQQSDMYINRVANASTNGIEYGQRAHLYSLRVGSETWIPSATGLVSSVSPTRNGVLSGTELVSIPDPFIYCPTNGQTYANFASVPAEVVNLDNVTFEVSGFIRETAAVRFNQLPKSKVTVRAIAGQEFIGKIFDDNVATLVCENQGAGLSGISSNDTSAVIEISDMIIASTSVAVGNVIGTFSHNSSRTGQLFTLRNSASLAMKTTPSNIMSVGSNIFFLINSVLYGGKLVVSAGSATTIATNTTAIPTSPLATATGFLNAGITYTNVIVVKPSTSTTNAMTVGVSKLNSASNDGTGNYGLFASIADFNDAEYGDFRLKNTSGLYKAGIGAFSPAYISPATLPVTLTPGSVPATSPYGIVPHGYVKIEVTSTGLVMKRWNGSSWTTVNVKRWNGSSWTTVNVKRWNGSSWT